ncbi:MAG: VanZ family protein [Chloroflexi bacterium]|nr:VanZ family protein [Chloroflexota bacterium]
MRRFAHNRLIAWLAAGLWLVLVVFLMLSPGEDSLAEDLSGAFGASELTDALGHVLLFGVLTALLFHALRLHVPAERALVVATAFTLGLGSVLEPAQLLVYERGAALLDLGANWTGALLSAWLLRRIAVSPPPAEQRVRASRRSDAPQSRR